MIIKSLSRKGRRFAAGSGRNRGSGASPFAALARYMHKLEKAERVRPVLWHNFYGGEQSREEDIVREFEDNASLLRTRVNGNVLYHEILSFSRGHALKDAELEHKVADIGQAYLEARAPDQLAYGVIHRDTEHVHLHLMISANRAGRPDRVRLSREEFAEAQKRTERFALRNFPELAQTRIYDRERPRERLKTEVHEQAMRARTKKPSRKEQLKSDLHQLFERASSADDLARLLREAGYTLYERGRSIGVTVKESGGDERRHRLSTLGVEDHYRASVARWESARPHRAQGNQTPPSRESEAPQDGLAPSRSAPDILRQELNELLSDREPPPISPTRTPPDRDPDRGDGR